MSGRMKTTLVIFGVILFFTVTGFFREHLFISINYQISKIYYNDSFEWQLPSDLKFLEHFTYNQLYYGKWILTFVFCLLYFVPTYLIIRKYFPGKIFSQITIYAHLVVFCLGGFFYLLGLITSDMDRWYDFSRNFLGFLQSPWILIMLFPSFLIMKKENNS